MVAIMSKSKKVPIFDVLMHAFVTLHPENPRKGVSMIAVKKHALERFEMDLATKKYIVRRFIDNRLADGVLRRLSGVGLSGSFRLYGQHLPACRKKAIATEKLFPADRSHKAALAKATKPQAKAKPKAVAKLKEKPATKPSTVGSPPLNDSDSGTSTLADASPGNSARTRNNNLRSATAVPVVRAEARIDAAHMGTPLSSRIRKRRPTLIVLPEELANDSHESDTSDHEMTNKRAKVATNDTEY